jgi:hypothetical protein
VFEKRFYCSITEPIGFKRHVRLIIVRHSLRFPWAVFMTWSARHVSRRNLSGITGVLIALAIISIMFAGGLIFHYVQ